MNLPDKSRDDIWTDAQLSLSLPACVMGNKLIGNGSTLHGDLSTFKHNYQNVK